jgi:hypothetical protein
MRSANSRSQTRSRSVSCSPTLTRPVSTARSHGGLRVFVLEAPGITADEAALALSAAKGLAGLKTRELAAQTLRQLAKNYVSGTQIHRSCCSGVFVDQSAESVVSVELVWRAWSGEA